MWIKLNSSYIVQLTTTRQFPRFMFDSLYTSENSESNKKWIISVANYILPTTVYEKQEKKKRKVLNKMK